jgi:hypothetical protein
MGLGNSSRPLRVPTAACYLGVVVLSCVYRRRPAQGGSSRDSGSPPR